MLDTNNREFVNEIAVNNGLPPELVAAIIQVESGWRVYAWNPEPRYRWLWNVTTQTSYRCSAEQAASKTPPKDFPCLAGDRDQEWWGQQASWGLLQVMGANARWLGFGGDFLPEIMAPRLNVELGCKLLANYTDKFKGRYGWAGVAQAYNGGPYAVTKNTNPGYAAKVLKALGGQWPA